MKRKNRICQSKCKKVEHIGIFTIVAVMILI